MSQDDEFFQAIFHHKGLPTFIEYLRGGEFQSWGVSQSLDFDLGYTFAISGAFDLKASYWLSMNLNQVPNRFASVEHIVYLGGKFKF